MAKEVSPGFLLGPGGRIDENEDVIASAVREVKEETGLTLDPTRVELKVVALHRYPDAGTVWVIFMTRTVLLSDPPPLIQTPEGTNEWIKISELKNQAKLLLGSIYYHEHILTPHPGIIYSNLEWSKGRLSSEDSKTTVAIP
jgi:8-oxo-dGTP pyrophosphatase MutT (NUDIX family)